MARIRTIKPEFFTSEDVVALSYQARLLYIATWCEADREGRLSWKPATLKMRYFPADGIDIDDLCKELIDAGLVRLYGDGFAVIPTFSTHQHINPRESISKLPAPDAPVTRHSRVSDAQGGKERKGKNRDASERDAMFDQFWTRYPKKVAKPAAEKAWHKINPSPDLLAAILAGIECQKSSAQWMSDGGKFIPHPSTWLSERRWEDEAAVVKGFSAGISGITAGIGEVI